MLVGIDGSADAGCDDRVVFAKDLHYSGEVAHLLGRGPGERVHRFSGSIPLQARAVGGLAAWAF